jgi:cellulose synthase/poly-beta-1,6-N-acetylglucosamine synthase-like glycosyltransferase
MFWLIHLWLWGSIGIVLLLLFQFLANLAVLVRLRSGPLPEKCPLVSVLVPARNEAKRIGPCLQSLLAQDYPRFECIVLDDQSDDGTADLVQQLGLSTDPAAQFRLIDGRPYRPIGSANHGPAISFPRSLMANSCCLPMRIRSIIPAPSPQPSM